MYTGIVDHIGRILKVIQRQNSRQFVIQTNFSDIIEGESIAINGVCVTAVDPNNNVFTADISPETLRLTNLKSIKENDGVNLERSLQASDRLGGHFVMGHVDTTAQIAEIDTQGEYTKMIFNHLSKQAMQYFVKKGSVAVNGISLTINEIFKDGFAVMLIPHTLQRTNLQFLHPGDEVNIEYDLIARFIVKKLEEQNHEHTIHSH